MAIVWGAAGLILLVTLVDSVIRYRKTERHEPAPLAPEEQRLCAQIVDSGLAKPFICRRALDEGACPCLPCRLLERAKRDELPLKVPGGRSLTRI